MTLRVYNLATHRESNMFTPSDWTDLSLKDLFYAYRKAKADCFFDRTFNSARDFVEYEANLVFNLQSLLKALHQGNINWVLDSNLGAPALMAKKLGFKPKGTTPQGHAYFSDPHLELKRLANEHDLEPEFRIFGTFPVVTHIMSALWINIIGHKFDEALTDSAYGARLRRMRSSNTDTQKANRYHIRSVGSSFEKYIYPYRQWRERGLHAIRRELMVDQKVIAISLDFTNYYHYVDPNFITKNSFLSAAKIDLNQWETQFTYAFSRFLKKWASNSIRLMKSFGCLPQSDTTGLPIGLSITPIIANVLLFQLDQRIERDLSPVYYGRYVDDLFLVLRDPGGLTSASDVYRFLAAKCKCFPSNISNKTPMPLKLPGRYQGKTRLLLQPTKQKCFFLHGTTGLDLLENIEAQIRSVSSERRLMPSPRQLTRMASARVLTADGDVASEADNLRKADGLVVRRLGWSVQLRAVETLARDLRREEWRSERLHFYDFAHRHILRADRILDHVDYFPRLLSLSVAVGDWTDARRLTEAALASLAELSRVAKASEIRINGQKIHGSSDLVWKSFEERLKALACDSLIRSIPWSRSEKAPLPLPGSVKALCTLIGLPWNKVELLALAERVREADWAKISYKDHLRRHARAARQTVPDEVTLLNCYGKQRDLADFLEHSMSSSGELQRVNPVCQASGIGSVVPFLFPTRPYSNAEIAQYLPAECIFTTLVNGRPTNPGRLWARYVRAVRGTWPKPRQANPRGDDLEDRRSIAILNDASRPGSIRLGISSLSTLDDSWRSMASGNPDLSPTRYERVQRVVNQAITAFPRPTYLLLPELSLPARWIDTISNRLGEANINLIAGLDYHHPTATTIHSSAVLVLADDRLGYPSRIQIRQLKSMPAPREEDELSKLFGKTWHVSDAPDSKPIYRHQGLCFGVLICSELQNMKHRLDFQGRVDCLMILSWNKDLETFSALVESASLDVHASVALVNNRRFGDSRVRVPAKKSYERDLCRIQGGLNEHVIIVQIDVDNLRAFQSRGTRRPSDRDLFKPVPEGFSIASYRRTIPR